MNSIHALTLLNEVCTTNPEDVVVEVAGIETRFPQACEKYPPEQWQAEDFETQLGIKLPEDLVAVWMSCAGLRLFVDATYGQWGFVLWSPSHAKMCSGGDVIGLADETCPGDLVVGEFLGEAVYVIVRCNASEPDFGSVVVSYPLDSRDNWPTVEKSFKEFISHIIDSKGRQYWL